MRICSACQPLYRQQASPFPTSSPLHICDARLYDARPPGARYDKRREERPVEKVFRRATTLHERRYFRAPPPIEPAHATTKNNLEFRHERCRRLPDDTMPRLFFCCRFSRRFAAEAQSYPHARHIIARYATPRSAVRRHEHDLASLAECFNVMRMIFTLFVIAYRCQAGRRFHRASGLPTAQMTRHCRARARDVLICRRHFRHASATFRPRHASARDGRFRQASSRRSDMRPGGTSPTPFIHGTSTLPTYATTAIFGFPSARRRARRLASQVYFDRRFLCRVEFTAGRRFDSPYYIDFGRWSTRHYEM